MIRSLSLPTLFLILTGVACAQTRPGGRVPRVNPDAPTTAYVNGLWYEVVGDGPAAKIQFLPGDRYNIAGVFTATRPDGIDQTIDLGGAHVVPPFGEAHNHSVDGPGTLATANRYLAQGIFFYKNPNNRADVAARGAALFNQPRKLDLSLANGGLSIRGGHPEGLYRYLSRFSGDDPERLDGQAFFATPTPEDVTRRWPEILRGRPDFIKLYLLDVTNQAGGKPQGLPPDTFRRAVALATEAGLRTTVHVETAADLMLAADAGATESAHLPGYNWATGLDAAAYRITDEQARRLAERGFLIATTTLVTEGTPTPTPEATERKRQIQALQVENIRRLAAAGVPLVIGCDTYPSTALDEVLHLRKLGALPDADLLRLWVETAPRSIFPRRAIGRLAPGFEASFLALDGDPTADLTRVTRIRTRIKQGLVLD